VPGSGVPSEGAGQGAGAEAQNPCGLADQAANAWLLDVFNQIHS